MRSLALFHIHHLKRRSSIYWIVAKLYEFATTNSVHYQEALYLKCVASLHVLFGIACICIIQRSGQAKRRKPRALFNMA